MLKTIGKEWTKKEDGVRVVWSLCRKGLPLVPLPRRELHDLCAGSKALFGSPGVKWSAVHGSFGCGPSRQIQQTDALSRTCFARR